MGHRLSKSVSSVVSHQQQQQQQQQRSSKISQSQNHHHHHHHSQRDASSSASLEQQNLNNNLQLLSSSSSSLEIDATQATISSGSDQLRLESATLTVPAQVAASAPRRFIIKIQLTKMEPGGNVMMNDVDDTTTLSTTLAITDDGSNNSSGNAAITATTTSPSTTINHLDNNLNITKPVLNLTFTKNIPCDASATTSSSSPIDQYHQFIIESANNETEIQLNNLNAISSKNSNSNLSSVPATTIISNNFVNNFAAVAAVSSSLLNDEEGNNNNNLAGHLNNLNLTATTTPSTGLIISNSSNINNHHSISSSNNKSSNNSNDNIINSSSNSNSSNSSNNLNCFNNNINNNSTTMVTVNSIQCNQNKKYPDMQDINQSVSSSPTSSGQQQQQQFNSTMCSSSGEDEKAHCCRKKKSSAYPAKWRCCKCSCRDSSKLTNTTTASCNSSSKQQDQPAVKSSSKSSWTSKFNCTKTKDSSESTKQQNINTSSSLLSPPPLCTSYSSSSSSSSSSSTSSSKSSSPTTLVPWASSSNSFNNPSASDHQRQQQQQLLPASAKAIATSTFKNLQPTGVVVAANQQQQQQQLNRTCPRSDHLTMWEPILPLTPFIDHQHHHHHHHHHHHIQTIARCPGGPHNLFVFSVNNSASASSSSSSSSQPSAQQFVFGQIEDLDERARRLRALEIETGLVEPLPTDLESALANVLSPQTPWHHIMCAPSSNFGTVVHSQVDYIHCLVPDLEKITSSSFYWGKMDRYEAERLLEGKPEGTFLLRDSAQEEYLFSVTFRKYGRSLHARIEQFNHKFSFDGHDPGVFTANTVTGLLEHYKDPSCVMFFEPMLTIPLHRNFTFSLQQLCRATIVSHNTYDGINELHLPNSLKSYLKEYHYKLRVRVKPFDEPFYTSCS